MNFKKILALVTLVSVVLYLLTTSSIDSYSDIEANLKSIHPDSLEAYKLNPQQIETLSEWRRQREIITGGNLDDWMGKRYLQLQEIGLKLLEQSTLFRIKNDSISAKKNTNIALELGSDLVKKFKDPFLLDHAQYVENLDRRQLQRRAKASFIYAQACEPFYKREYKIAREKFKLAHKFAEKAGDLKLSIDALSILQWYVMQDKEDHREVIEISNKIIKQAKKIGYKRRLAVAFQHSSEAYRELDQDGKALLEISKAISIARLMNDTYVLSNSYLVQLQIFKRMEKLIDALDVLEKLSKIDVKGRYKGFVKLHTGQISAQLGEYGKAQTLYEQALKIFEEQNDIVNQSVTLTSLSSLQLLLGNYENALKLEMKSKDLIIETGRTGEWLALIYTNLGRIYEKMGKFNEAINAHQEALDRFENEAIRFQADTWLELGNLKLKQKIYEDARESFRVAIDLSKSIGYKYGMIASMIGNGRIALNSNNLNEADSLFSTVLNKLVNTKLPVLKANALFGLSKIQKRLNNLDKAFQYLDKAIYEIESLRESINRDSLRVSYFATTQDLFDEAISISIDRGKNDLALQYAEQARARALFDIFEKPAFEDIRPQQQSLLDYQIHSIDKLIFDVPDSVQILEYRITSDLLLVWFISNKKLVLHKVPISREQLEKQVHNFLLNVGIENLNYFQNRVKNNIQKVYEENRKLGKELFKLLLSPIFENLTIDKQLFIIPDGILHRLPFGALVTNENEFFDERQIWVKAPSLSILSKSDEWPKKPIHSQNSRFLMVAGNLPSVRAQAKLVKQLYKNAVVLQDKMTNYNFVKKELESGYSTVYFSVHSVADPVHPMNSFIELNDENNPSGKKKIYSRQLLDLDFSKTSLAILNACETSSGKVVPGEGILNLVRIFSLSHVPVVVASLSKNDDRRSAEIIDHFIKALSTGKDPAHALHTSKKNLIVKLKHDDGYPLPYFWSVFEVYKNVWNINHNN